jgi:hypothetical protein
MKSVTGDGALRSAGFSACRGARSGRPEGLRCTYVKCALAIGLALIGLAPARVSAQVRDAPAAGTGVIRGVVVTDDAEARPVGKARVTCGAPDVAGNTTITDAQGRFEFAALPAARYAITASKPTWVMTNYGATRPMRAGTPIPLAAGQRLDIVVRLARGAVITGVLLDHDNQPAAGALVRALRYQMSGGERRLVSAGDSTADDRGVYRIFGLAAGEYFVSASARGLGGMTAGDLRLSSDADLRDVLSAGSRTPPPPRMVALAPAYFPSGSSVSEAAVVSLRTGEERGGIDFNLQLVPTARIEGTISVGGSSVPASTEINLIAIGSTAADGLPFQGYRPGRPGSDGAFSLAGVPPGQFTLLARASRPVTNADGSAAAEQTLWASTQIAVDGEPITGLVLSLEPALTIAGRVRFSSSALKPPDLRTVAISALPVDSLSAVSFAPPDAMVGADGRFVVSGVIPGRYRLSASFPGIGRPAGWSIESITANGQDALDGTLTIVANEHVLDALVTFTDHLAQLSGIVRVQSGSAAGVTVILFPEDQRAWVPRSRRIQGTRASTDGAYVFRNVPAGRYLVAAVVDDVESGEWFDAALLQRLRGAATRVAIGTADVVLDLASSAK